MQKIPVLIDTDPGMDDFVAIMLAASSEKLDIKGICAVAGNLALEKTSRNLRDIAGLLNLEMPIAKGAAKPLNHELTTAEAFHGEEGLGSLRLETSNKEFDERYAWDLLYDVAKESKGKLNVIAVGPLTNIATAILKYPNIGKYIERITIMGGSAGKGNCTPTAEFNIWGDPFAADIVFKSKIPVTMVGLDATRDGLINGEEIEEILAVESKYSKEITSIFRDLHAIKKTHGVDGVMIHDAITVGAVIDPSLVSGDEYYVAIETREGLNYGRTVVDLDNSHRDKDKNVRVALKTDTEKFKNMLKDMLNTFK